MGVLDALQSARPTDPSRFEAALAPLDAIKNLHPGGRLPADQGTGAPGGAGGGGGGGQGGGAGGGGAGSAGGSPSFTDLRLPNEIQDVIADALKDYDMRLDIQQKEQVLGEPCSFHVAVNGGFSVSLLHFNAEYLEDPKWLKEIGSLGWMFDRGEKVRVVSKDCQKLHESFVLMWSRWSESGIETEYAEWRNVASLQRLKGQQRATMLKQAFRFPPTVQPRTAPRTPLDLLQDNARFTVLVRNLSEIGQSSGSASVNAWINDLLRAGSVPEAMRLERQDWGNNYPEASRAMIEWLLRKGADPVNQGYSYLGFVLKLWTESIGEDRKTQVLEILVRFRLIPNDAAQPGGGG